MKTADTQAPIEQQVLALIAKTLAEKETFAHKFDMPPSIHREINIQVVWDLEAYEFMQDFEVLTLSWRHLSFAEPLYALRRVLTAIIDRVRAKKAQGKKGIYGYEVRETLINSVNKRSFSILVATTGETKGKASQKVLKTKETRSVIVNNYTKEKLLDTVAATLTQFDDQSSNIPAISDTETLLLEMLATIESRLLILRPLSARNCESKKCS